jgi:multicomponent Na+:H+ antiporter subunit A
MLWAVLAGVAAACAAPSLAARFPRSFSWLLALVPAALFAWFCTFIPRIHAGETVRHAWEWVPALGVSASFHLDGLSLLFALLITGLGALIVVYAGSYLHGHVLEGRFFLYLLSFMSAMLGLVLADNLVTLFVFWELTSVTSYMLIGFDHEKPEARRSALQALLITGIGGLAMMAGFLLLGTAAGGSLELSEIRQNVPAVLASPLATPAFFLIAAGAFTKSAQFPFHAWLPNAMAAPTPVSAYLHSATMVKAGVYLLARVQPVLGELPAWVPTLVSVGATTMLVGAVLALFNTDLKRILAYSTVASLGTLVMLLGLGFTEAGFHEGGVAGSAFQESVKAAMVFLLAHSLYKGALFLVAGAVDHETGSRDVRVLGGLRAAMPWTAAAAVVAGLSMAGLPPLFGFISKELAYKANLGSPTLVLVLVGAAFAANTLGAAAAGLVAFRPFFGPRRDTPRPAHEAPWPMLLGPVMLASAGLVFGLLPAPTAGRLIDPAASAVLAEQVSVKLTLWYGLDAALVLSVLTLAGGIGVYLLLGRGLQPRLAGFDRVFGRFPDRSFDTVLDGLLRLARAQTAVLQGGGLRQAIAIVIGVAAALSGAALLRAGIVPPFQVPAITLYEALLGVLVLAGAVAVILSTSRLGAVLSVGIVGFGVALLFALVGAPDLAITQFLVETLTVIIVLLAVRRLPRLAGQRARGAERVRNAVVAVVAGGMVTGLLLTVQALPFQGHLSAYFDRESVPAGFGANVVNVILVDFRALDTLGEIIVLAVAALGAFALLRLSPDRDPRPAPGAGSLILSTATRLLTPLLLLFAVFLLWRGHNEPGGGFIGGLVAGGAIALCAVAFGTEKARRILRIPPRALVGTGLAVAGASGLFAMALGLPYMSAAWGTFGEGLKLGTPLLFDVGVFLVVVGFTVTLVLSLEEA